MRSLLRFTMIIVVLLCVLMVVSFAIRSLRDIEQRRLRPSLITSAQQISDEMEQEYLSLIHLSQQMISTGYVGESIEDYLQTGNQYERIVKMQRVTENLSNLTFSYPKSQIAAYLLEDRPKISNMSFKKGFSVSGLPVLQSSAEIVFHPLHPAGCSFSQNEVVSISRTAELLGQKYVIYLEGRSDASAQLQGICTSQGIPYALLQLDEKGRIVYSTLSDFPAGTLFDLSTLPKQSEGLGKDRGYVFSSVRTSFGFRNVLLLPVSDYEREINELQWRLLLTLALVILLVVFISWVLYNQFYHPLKTLEYEMDRFGKGNTVKTAYQVHIREYNSLFERFNDLKEQIALLMDSVKSQEADKRSLELDKLYYQINPHFLMNALNSAQWQAAMEHQTELAAYLSKLNYLLGYTLGKVERRTTIRLEIKVLMDYLELQQTRQDFQVNAEVKEGFYLDRPCARLILQPIAENAVCHNINEFGNLWLSVSELETHEVEIVVRDDGAGFDPAVLRFQDPPVAGEERQTENGIGLRYVYLSLQEYYGGKAVMEVESAPGRGTSVRIILPYLNNSKEKGE